MRNQKLFRAGRGANQVVHISLCNERTTSDRGLRERLCQRIFVDEEEKKKSTKMKEEEEEAYIDKPPEQSLPMKEDVVEGAPSLFPLNISCEC